MKFIARLLGLLFLIVAVIAGAIDATKSVMAEAVTLTSLGQAWLANNPDSLGLSEAVVKAYLPDMVWDNVIAWILLQPVWIVFAALALLFYWMGARRHRVRRIHG